VSVVPGMGIRASVGMAADAGLLAVLAPPAVVVDEDPGARSARIARIGLGGAIRLDLMIESDIRIVHS